MSHRSILIELPLLLDILEKSNLFLENVIATIDKPWDDRYVGGTLNRQLMTEVCESLR